MSKSLIPYATIIAAQKGNPEAMCTILGYFDQDIRRAARRTISDEFGNRAEYIDQDAMQHISEKLMLEIINRFDCTKLPEGEKLKD